MPFHRWRSKQKSRLGKTGDRCHKTTKLSQPAVVVCTWLVDISFPCTHRTSSASKHHVEPKCVVNTPTHLVAFATGRHSGGDVSARNVLVRTSTMGGIAGSWSTPKIIANVSASSLQAGDGLYTGTVSSLFLLATLVHASNLLTPAFI